jgi:putative transposase
MVRRDRLRRLHYRIASIRKDAMHKATTAIAKAFRTVVIEDLHVAGMAKNKRLAGAVLDASFGEARRQLEYKMAMRGGRVVVVDRFFPSSKRCHCCGNVLDALPLQVREWTCPHCGTVHDRDMNAAINLELIGATCSESAGNDATPTRGETEALAVGQLAVKPRSRTRELEPAAAGKSAVCRARK